MWQVAWRRSAASTRAPWTCFQARVASTSASPVKEDPAQKQEPAGGDSASKVTVTASSDSLPPLVRSLLVKAAGVWSKQKPDTAEDPVSSLFVRSGKQESNHGLEFLVDVKRFVPQCPLESEETPLQLANVEKLTLAQRLDLYLALGKARLSALVVLTTSFGYGLALTSSSAVAMHSPLAHFAMFAATTLGTAFLAIGANTLNQFAEAPYDSQMPRTRNRPLAVRALSPEHSLITGISSGIIGTAILAATTNPVATGLGVANLLLYSAVYTPMKRTSAYNTWVGAIVGTLPPLMGWAAATGGHIDHGAYVLAAILFSWQFPHFTALSWNMKGEYARAGYQVQAVVDPPACRRAALRHSVVLTGLCSVAAPLTHLVPWSFAVLSLPANIYLLKLAYRFRQKADASSARTLFHYSLIYLPSLLVLLLATGWYGR